MSETTISNLRAYTLSFREPRQGEFGHTHCQGQLLYLKFGTESKPLNWFLGENETNGDQVIWEGCDEHSSFFDHIKIFNNRVSPDGSYPIDSPTGVTPIQYRMLGGRESDILDSKTIKDEFDLATDTESPPYVVVTNKLLEEDIVKEFSEMLVIDSYIEFESLINFLAYERYGRNTFTAQKKVVQEAVHIPMKSQQILCEAKGNYYEKVISKYSKGGSLSAKIPNIIAVDFFKLTDEEIISLWYSSHQSVNFIDARYLINVSTTPYKTSINTSTKLYLGKIQLSSEGSKKSTSFALQNLLLVSGFSKDRANHVFHTSFNSDTSFFELHALSKAESSNKRGYSNSGSLIHCKDLLTSSKLIGKIADKFGDSDVIGCASTIPLEKFDDVINLIADYDRHNKIQILPNKPLGNLGDSISARVSIDVKLDRLVKVEPLRVNISDFTHNELDDLENAIICSYLGTPSTTCCLSSRSKKTEERLDIVSEKLEEIFKAIEPLLRGYWKFILGNSSIDRGFLIVDTDQNHHHNSYRSVEPEFYCVYTDDMLPTIALSPSFSLLLVFSKFVSFYKTMDEAIESIPEAKDFPTALEAPTIGCKERVAQLESIIARLHQSQNTIPSKAYSYNGLNLFQLRDCKILEILCAVCFELLIENQAFINFSSNSKTILRPRDVIRYILGQRSYKNFQLMRSVYA